MSMSMPRPAPVPRKRAVSGPSLSQNSTSSSDLQVTGLRSTLDEMSMPELRAVLDDVASLHELIMNLNVPRVCIVAGWVRVNFFYVPLTTIYRFPTYIIYVTTMLKCILLGSKLHGFKSNLMLGILVCCVWQG